MHVLLSVIELRSFDLLSLMATQGFLCSNVRDWIKGPDWIRLMYYQYCDLLYVTMYAQYVYIMAYSVLEGILSILPPQTYWQMYPH
jgi:hypothetical protein